VNFFEDRLIDPWMKLLLDQVADVRTACVASSSKLLSVAGATWIQREILPHYVRIYDDSVSYLTRITIIRSYASLAMGNDKKKLTPALLDEIVNQCLRGLDDRVANVRMVSARSLAAILKNCENGNSRIRTALQARLSEDEDDDCRYFAKIALDSC